MFRKLVSAALALSLAAGLAFAQTGLPRMTPPVNYDNSPRVRELIRAGNLYLSLQDALALAIENNLDIELQRYALPIADMELLRTKGGGTVRGLNFTLAEAPTGTGGPLSPVNTNAAAAGRATSGSSITTNALELTVLGEPLVNESIQGTIPQTNGAAIPSFDPSLFGQLNWIHSTAPQSATSTTGLSTLVANSTTYNAGIQQGFSTGATASLNFLNNSQSVNSLRTSYNPYTNSALGLTITQPLLRGSGMSVNRRFIRIALNEQKMTSLLFHQQLILTVYGVIRLYTDMVALTEDEKVKAETVTLAEKLRSDVRAQVDEGTLAPVELTRANAQVSSTRQDLINARGLREEQEAILKNVLTRRGNEDPEVMSAHLIPTDTLTIPATDEIRPMQDLIAEALSRRPDLGQARLQVVNSQIGLEGARSATRPQLDLIGIMQNSALAGDAFPFAPSPSPDPNMLGGYGTALSQIFTRKYPTYGVGVQMTLPIHNRVAEADLARDELQVKQNEIRLRQLQNQARLEVEDALIAMRRARASYDAAVEARALQQESLDAEQAKFEVGASTSFFVIQYENLLAQARSTEVAARSSYVKAKAALQRAMGNILEENHIALESAMKGRATP
ncbi:MAG TPA: TolC family protein [Verrucomicrobiae bacterium]|nr:TolC family protein [Verrucomicrobiae bacterium]